MAVFLAFAWISATCATDAAESKYASIVVEAGTGKIMHEDNPDVRNYPASLTKLMTLYLLFEAIDSKRITWDTRFTASRHASSMSPTKLNLAPGESLTAREAAHAIMIISANDVAVVVGEALGGTEDKFALLMTDKARKLGMSRTTFRNASGLPHSGQMSTARDMATLAQAILTRFPNYYSMFAEQTFVYSGRTYRTHNHVTVDYPGADGLKTGFTQASGFNLVTSAVHDSHRLIGVVFGGNTARARDKQMEVLLDQAFATYHGGGSVAGVPMVRNEVPATKGAKGKKATVVASVTKASPKVAATPEPVETAEGDTDASDGDGWGIQVGAFNQQGPARNAAQQVVRKYSAVLDGGEISVVPLSAKSKRGVRSTLYRARIMGIEKGAAYQVCRMIKKAGQPCMELRAPASGEQQVAERR